MYTIEEPVECKRPEWQELVDIAVKTGSARPLKGVTPDGLPPGGIWEYRRRSPYGRVYLMYALRLPGEKNRRTYHAIWSVDSDYAESLLAWKPQPNCEREFNLESGPVLAMYDHMALPERIVPRVK